MQRWCFTIWRTSPCVDRVGQEISALLRRLGIPYHRKDDRLRINGVALKNWFQPKLDSPFSTKPGDLRSSQVPLGNQITRQQRSIRLGNLSLEWELRKRLLSFWSLPPRVFFFLHATRYSVHVTSHSSRITAERWNIHTLLHYSSAWGCCISTGS